MNIRYAHGITAVDTHYVRPELDAAYCIVNADKAVIIDTGAARAAPAILSALQAQGIGAGDVEALLLTHVHLDHAGGAGQLMRALPNARLIVHPRGAPHIVDPAKLIAGTTAVYGAGKFRELYGELLPVAAERVHITTDAERLQLIGRNIECVFTPGHALHHQAFCDLDSGGIFSGDTFGISYREFDCDGRAFIVPTTTPTQFDPQQLDASIDRLVARRPSAIYLTHYGAVTEIDSLAVALKQQIAAFVSIATRHAPLRAAESHCVANIRAEMRDLWIALAERHGTPQATARVDELLGNDLDLNSAGLYSWLQRQAH